MRFRLGFGTLAAVVIAVAIFVHTQQRQATPPVVHDTHGTSSPHDGGGDFTPAPDFLLAHAKALKLSAAQQAKIAAVVAAYNKDTDPVRKRLKPAMAEFGKFMDARQQDGNTVSEAEIAERGKELQQITSTLIAARHSYWKQAVAVLTPAQQAQVNELKQQIGPQDLH